MREFVIEHPWVAYALSIVVVLLLVLSYISLKDLKFKRAEAHTCYTENNSNDCYVYSHKTVVTKNKNTRNRNVSDNYYNYTRHYRDGYMDGRPAWETGERNAWPTYDNRNNSGERNAWPTFDNRNHPGDINASNNTNAAWSTHGSWETCGNNRACSAW